MKTDTQKAKELLEKNHYTCVLKQSGTVYTTTERGVKPLLDWHKDELDLQGFCAADKVVGKAAAFLYVLLGIKEVYAPVMSNGAIEILFRYGVQPQYDLSVKHIINRAGTGMCPMEQAVMDVSEPEQAWEAIIRKWRILQETTKAKTY